MYDILNGLHSNYMKIGAKNWFVMDCNLLD
jgi:hypothetical protein